MSTLKFLFLALILTGLVKLNDVDASNLIDKNELPDSSFKSIFDKAPRIPPKPAIIPEDQRIIEQP